MGTVLDEGDVRVALSMRRKLSLSRPSPRLVSFGLVPAGLHQRRVAFPPLLLQQEDGQTSSLEHRDAIWRQWSAVWT